ncbi:MAG: aminotransferase class IV [Oscillospiraceae bacterium]|jgi:D-alanine transaminase|nr:aminotransferase class IV [Oscillospiraceae bacterium]MCI1990096.1 aminotransferase class IV [Oscillospiraceae bacterium]MCI2034758.1 aminotransferase class IV [Oscillospiraceae bacterium]
MKNLGYYNGKTGPVEEMTIPMNDRSTYFGDGVYDATYAVNHVIYKIDDHLDRFYNSFRKLRIPFRMPREKLAETLQECVDRVDDGKSLFVYWQTTRGTGMRNHVFPEGDPNLLITVSPSPLRAIGRKFKLITEEDTRFYHCDIKTLNLIPSVMAAQKAKEAGCDEAVFHRGFVVTECAHSNISILKDGAFRTAPLSNLILPGTARKHLVALAKANGIPVDETAFTVDELMDADEVVIHSSGTLCNAVTEIDGKPVGGKAPKLLKRLQDAVVKEFEDYTKVKFADYAE